MRERERERESIVQIVANYCIYLSELAGEMVQASLLLFPAAMAK